MLFRVGEHGVMKCCFIRGAWGYDVLFRVGEHEVMTCCFISGSIGL